MNAQDHSFDVIIPVAMKDISFLRYVIPNLRKNVLGVSTIYVISNKKNIGSINSMKIEDSNFSVIDEDNIIPEVSFDIVDNILKNKKISNIKTGWYLQQFIKMGFSLSSYSKKYYLSWDSDTIPLTTLNFFNEEHPYFTIKKEYHKSYFDTIEKLIDLHKITDYSFIAEHMLFNVDIMKELISHISKNQNIEGNNWVEKCLNACNVGDKNPYSFSEFETYGTFCAKYYPNLYETRKLNTFRSAGLIRGRRINDKLLKSLSLDLDIASFELYDIPPFPYNIDYYIYRLKEKIDRIKTLISYY